jgi:4-aminobutyrate--pyruvate transaminase
VLEIYDRDGLVETVRTHLGPHFQARMTGLRSAFPGTIGDARGLGLVGAVELVADPQTKRPFPPEAAAAALVAKLAQQRGLIVRALAGDAVAVCPPLISTTEQLDTIFDRLADAMAQAERELAPWEAM